MIKQKECGDKDCTNTFPQYNSLQKYCSTGCKVKNSKVKNRGSGIINPISDKKMKELAIYRPLSKKYLKENPVCEVKGCGKPSTNIHHKNGRTGKRLYDLKYFLACCGTCHPKRIHENPKWARKNGYLI